ncbi:MAG: hypothetical protein ACLFSG_02330 [Halothiobacillaceae bacterium]
MRTLTIALPGLPGDWPEMPVAGELPVLPRLTRRLDRGDRRGALPEARDHTVQWLARFFGWPVDETLPVARLRLLGEPDQHGRAFGPESGFWLCADPVSLKAEPDHALVFGHGLHELTEAESVALVESLKAHFAPDGWSFVEASPERWYVRLPEPARIHTTPLWIALRRNAAHLLPRAPEGVPDARFAPRRWLAEIEMLLYNHPVNAARAARGQPQVNSVWLHGEGAWPDDVQPTHCPRFDAVIADDPLLRGLARWSKLPVLSAAAAFASPHILDDREHLLWIETDAWWTNLEGNLAGWKAALEAVEARFARAETFRPREIRLHGPFGHVISRDWHRWRFWRKPTCPLARLVTADRA